MSYVVGNCIVNQLLFKGKCLVSTQNLALFFSKEYNMQLNGVARTLKKVHTSRGDYLNKQ